MGKRLLTVRLAVPLLAALIGAAHSHPPFPNGAEIRGPDGAVYGMWDGRRHFVCPEFFEAGVLRVSPDVIDLTAEQLCEVPETHYAPAPHTVITDGTNNYWSFHGVLERLPRLPSPARRTVRLPPDKIAAFRHGGDYDVRTDRDKLFATYATLRLRVERVTIVRGHDARSGDFDSLAMHVTVKADDRVVAQHTADLGNRREGTFAVDREFTADVPFSARCVAVAYSIVEEGGVRARLTLPQLAALYREKREGDAQALKYVDHAHSGTPVSENKRVRFAADLHSRWRVLTSVSAPTEFTGVVAADVRTWDICDWVLATGGDSAIRVATLQDVMDDALNSRAGSPAPSRYEVAWSVSRR